MRNLTKTALLFTALLFALAGCGRQNAEEASDYTKTPPADFASAYGESQRETPSAAMKIETGNLAAVILDGMEITELRLVSAGGVLFAPYNSFDLSGRLMVARNWWIEDEDVWEWPGPGKPVHLFGFRENVRFHIGSAMAEIFGSDGWNNPLQFELDAAPFLLDGVPMIPVASAFEAFNAQVDWDEEARIMSISTANQGR